jgi:16S rRNA (guanine527-N7)-methyltransferase
MNELAQHTYELFGLRLTQPQLKAFSMYEKELLDWNTRYSLTAIREPEKIQIKHFLDSLSCLSVMAGSCMERVIDIGTGASVRKKTGFCEHVVKKLDLDNVDVIQGRAEILGNRPEHRQQYDWALARAVAVLPVLLEYLLPLVRVGGSVIAMKGEGVHSEVHNAEHAMRVLGGHLREIVQVFLPGVAEDRYLVIIDKVAATPPGYPRRIGVPMRKPL